MSNRSTLPDNLQTMFARIDPQALQQFTEAYQHWTLLHRISDLEQQIVSLQEEITENELQLQWSLPSAVALAAITRFQAYGVADLDLLDTMLERGETWLDRTLQLLEECERLGLIGDSYTVWCQNALEGAFDWIESMSSQSPETEQATENSQANLSIDDVSQNELAQQDNLLSALKAILLEPYHEGEKQAEETTIVPAEAHDTEATPTSFVPGTLEITEIVADPIETLATTDDAMTVPEALTSPVETFETTDTDMEPEEIAAESADTLKLAAIASIYAKTTEQRNIADESVETVERTDTVPDLVETPEAEEEVSKLPQISQTESATPDPQVQPDTTETRAPEEEKTEPEVVLSEQTEPTEVTIEAVEPPLSSDAIIIFDETGTALDLPTNSLETDTALDLPTNSLETDTALDLPTNSLEADTALDLPTNSLETDTALDLPTNSLETDTALDSGGERVESVEHGDEHKEVPEIPEPAEIVEASTSDIGTNEIGADETVTIDEQFTEPKLAAYTAPVYKDEAEDDFEYYPAQPVSEEQGEAIDQHTEEAEEDYTDLLTVDGTVTYLPANEAGGGVQTTARKPKRGFFLWRLLARLFRRSSKTSH